MISGLYKDPKKGTFTEKSSQLVVKVLRGDKSKSCGMVCLNLASYINEQLTAAAGQGQAGSFKEMLSMPIDKCPDKNALLHFTISSQLISITSGSETMSMMSGMCGADAMSIDSGPESEFRFQDLDESGAAGRSKGKRGPNQNMIGDANEDGHVSEVAQAYGITGKRISIKRRSQSSQQQIKKVIGAGGIPRPPPVAAKNDHPKMVGATTGDLEAEEIIQGARKPKDFLQVNLDEIEEPPNPGLEEDQNLQSQRSDAKSSRDDGGNGQKKLLGGKVIKIKSSKISTKPGPSSSSPAVSEKQPQALTS